MFKLMSSFVVAIVLLLSVFGTADSAAKAAPASGVIPGKYIVVFQDSVSNPNQVANDLARKHGLGLLYSYGYAIQGFAATIPSARLEAVKADPRVLFLSEDREVSIGAQTLPTGVDRIDAEPALRTNKGTGVNVAVIDTGIDLTHPDLQANIVGGTNCSTGKSYNDGNGHGSHVAGTIAAINNGVGV